MKIFVDFPVSGRALDVLQGGTAGHELIFARKPATSVLAEVEIDPAIAAAEVAVGQPDPAAIAGAKRLKWVQVSSSGFTRYDTAEFRELVQSRGIAVTHSAGVYAEACAVHVLSFLLAQVRGLPLALASAAGNGSADWKDLRARSSTLSGERVLILGFGSIGRKLAERLAPFGAEVTAFRRRERGTEGIEVRTDLLPALAGADHVVNILPGSSQTDGLIDSEKFSAMKDGAAFYNIGRGSTVDQAALLAALESGRLRAAWLDVTTPEPLATNHPLRAVENCYITPHLAGGHGDEALSLIRHFVANFQRFVAGEELAERIM